MEKIVKIFVVLVMLAGNAMAQYSEVRPEIELNASICVAHKRIYELRQEMINAIADTERMERIYTYYAPGHAHQSSIRRQDIEQRLIVIKSWNKMKKLNIRPMDCGAEILAEYVCNEMHMTTCGSYDTYTGEMVNVGNGIAMFGSTTHVYFWHEIYSPYDGK